MPVKKEPSGRRHVAAEVEVPGTPEQIWAAIATGPGISAWFVPSELEGRVGGRSVCRFGPGMDSVGTVTAWEPLRRFEVATEEEGPGPVATEWSVATRSGDTCVVRVVHSWFASTDDWDDQFEGHTHGWVAFFRILREYLAHFAGQSGASFQLMGIAPEPKSEAWKRLTGALGIADAGEGDRVRTSGGAPPLAGEVVRVGPPDRPELLVRTDAPAPGLVHLAPHAMQGQVFVVGRVLLFGEGAREAVAQQEPIWQAWMAERFAPAG